MRERREEIPPLVEHYLRKYSDEQKKGRLTIDDETLEYLLLYSWPGNVRQLANEVRRMVAMAEADATLTPALLSPEIQASRRTIPAVVSAEPEVRVRLDQPLARAVETPRADDGEERARSDARARRGSRAHARNLPEGPVPQAAPLGTPRATPLSAQATVHVDQSSLFRQALNQRNVVLARQHTADTRHTGSNPAGDLHVVDVYHLAVVVDDITIEQACGFVVSGFSCECCAQLGAVC